MSSQFISLYDYEKRALEILPENARDYYRSGAGNGESQVVIWEFLSLTFAENSLKWNIDDFNNFRIRPRFLRDVSKRDMNVNVFGSTVSFPCGISPTAMQKLAHPDGELATARGEWIYFILVSCTTSTLTYPPAAAKENVVAIFSTIGTTSMEEVAEAAPNATRWFQLYIYKDRKLTESIVRRAEKAGFKALVLTVDAPYFGLRRLDMKNKFSMPPHLTLANFQDVVTSSGGECLKVWMISI